jgi:tetratricopeptide (TPR) repeat protein
MSCKRVIIPATCVFLAVTILSSGCDNSTSPNRNIISEFNYAMKKSGAAVCIANGLELRHKGEYDKAIASYTKAIELDPEDADTYYFRGIAYEYKGEYDKAILDYTKAIEMKPEFSPFYCARGDTYSSEGEYDKAIADYTTAIDVDGSLLAYWNRGHTYVSKGEYDKAISDYTKVIETGPQDANAYYDRGLAYKLKGDYDKAAGDFEKVIQIARGSDLIEDAQQALNDIGK